MMDEGLKIKACGGDGAGRSDDDGGGDGGGFREGKGAPEVREK